MIDEAVVNYYELLQLDRSAADADIKAAISKKRRLWIKRQASADPGRRTEAETIVRQLDAAESALLDPANRRRYDQQLASQRPQAPAAVDGSADWLDRARAYLDAGNATAAQRAAREATTQRGNDHGAWAVRAHASFLLGQAADAEFEFAEAIRLEPATVEYHQDLGEVYGMQEKWTQALREFQAALRLSPGNPVARTSIAQVYLANERSREALKLMESVVAEHPDNEVFRFYLAAALDGAARESLTQLRDDSVLATSVAQVALLTEHADRIAALRLKDPEVRESIADLRGLAANATEMMWVHSANLRMYIGTFVVLVGIAICGLGSGQADGVLMGLFLFVPAACLVAYAYTQRHRKPRYEHARRIFAGDVVRPGI